MNNTLSVTYKEKNKNIIIYFATTENTPASLNVETPTAYIVRIYNT